MCTRVLRIRSHVYEIIINSYFIFVGLWTASIAIKLPMTVFLSFRKIHLKFFLDMGPPKRLRYQFQILFRFWIRKFVNFGDPWHRTNPRFHFKSLKFNVPYKLRLKIFYRLIFSHILNLFSFQYSTRNVRS